MRMTIWRVIIMAVLLVGLSFEQVQENNFFKIQISPVIDGKPIRPANYSIGKDLSSPFAHQITVSSINFLKNITVGMQLYAWYNGGWIAKKNRVLQITDKLRIVSQQDKILSRFLKFNSIKLNQLKEPVILNKTNIFISYDPESSLMVSQLEQPNFFIPPSDYIPVRHISKEIQRINITMTFLVVNKSDAFIQNKRRLGELIEIQNRVPESLAIVNQPIGKDVIEPRQIWDGMRRNFYSFIGQQKKVNQKLALINRYGLKNVLVQGINNYDLSQFLPLFQELLSKYKISFKDSATPVWRWIFGQSSLLDRIQVLQQAMLRDQGILIERDVLKEVIELSERRQNVKRVVNLLWITVDIVSYVFAIYNIGVSRSYGAFLNVWIILQIISVAVRVGFALHILAGLAVFLLGIILHWIICYFIQKRFALAQHNGTYFDKFATLLMRNTLISIMFVNLYLHIFHNSGITFDRIRDEGFGALKRLEGDFLNNLLWSFSELMELLSEYYYVLVIVPQILLNFRFFNVEKATILRIVMLFGLIYCNWPLHELDNHWMYKVFRLKQGILAIVLTIQLLLFRNKQNLKLIEQNQNAYNKNKSEDTKQQSKRFQVSEVQLKQKNKGKAK